MFLSLLFLVVLSTTACGEEQAIWKETNSDEFEGPRHQLAVRVGMRTDETDRVDAQPEVSVRYFRWFSRFVAVTADFGFTNESVFSYRSEARTLAFGTGLRLQEPGQLVSVFFEPGVSIQNHRGDLDGSDFSSTRFGLSLALGASINIGGGSHLDLTLRQTLNAPESRPVYATTPLVPDPPVNNNLFVMGGADPYDLYNPTHILISYRFGL
jgi:hypothetical protein